MHTSPCLCFCQACQFCAQSSGWGHCMFWIYYEYMLNKPKIYMVMCMGWKQWWASLKTHSLSNFCLVFMAGKYCRGVSRRFTHCKISHRRPVLHHCLYTLQYYSVEYLRKEGRWRTEATPTESRELSSYNWSLSTFALGLQRYTGYFSLLFSRCGLRFYYMLTGVFIFLHPQTFLRSKILFVCILQTYKSPG